MPWWIWLVLVAFMLIMLIAGAAYVVMRGLALMHVVTDLGAAVGERVGNIAKPESDPTAPKPIFTEPLHVASNRYATAHTQVLQRRAAARRRHIARWGQWLRFNS